MDRDEALLAALRDVLAPDPNLAPSDQQVAALREAVSRRAPAPVVDIDRARPARATRPSRRWLAPVVAAAAVVVAFAVGRGLTDRSTSPGDQAPLEFDATLRAPQGDGVTSIRGQKVGIGRIVTVRSDDLPILAKGQFYEVWFVGPGDAPATPNRISAGTFHPDEQGRTRVTLTAAVDPTKYPSMVISAEPGDGDPRPSGLDVAAAEVRLR